MPNSPGKTAGQFALGLLGLTLITVAAPFLALQPGSVSLLYLMVVVFVSLIPGEAQSTAEQAQTIALNRYKAGPVRYLDVIYAQTALLAKPANRYSD